MMSVKMAFEFANALPFGYFCKRSLLSWLNHNNSNSGPAALSTPRARGLAWMGH